MAPAVPDQSHGSHYLPTNSYLSANGTAKDTMAYNGADHYAHASALQPNGQESRTLVAPNMPRRYQNASYTPYQAPVPQHTPGTASSVSANGSISASFRTAYPPQPVAIQSTPSTVDPYIVYNTAVAAPNNQHPPQNSFQSDKPLAKFHFHRLDYTLLL
jgi:hypothetical protein